MSSIKLFESKQIRSEWNETEQEWYFSIIDVVEVLTESSNPRDYWFKMKLRVKTEDGLELSTICRQLKMKAADGKNRETDVANTKSLLRIIQSIPSPRAEPFKQWLAQVGYERIQEVQDPELSIDRAMENYTRLGYSKNWINQRLKSIEVRKELTDEWEKRGVKKGQQYATLTDIITKGWSGLTTGQYKKLKELKKENLRDNMTNLELALNMLAEATTTEISKEKKPKTLDENKAVAKRGGNIVGNTRRQIESETGKRIVTSQNAKVLSMAEKKKLK